LTEERRRAIEQLVSSKGEALLCELEELFPDISSMTLRRDLIYLEKMGIVRRTRGGAISVSRINKPYEDAFSRRAQRDIIAKRAICRAALELLSPDSTVFLDSGSTLMHFAQMIPDENFLVVTTGPNIALELAAKAKPDVLLLGGRLRRNTLSVSGAWAAAALEKLNIDTAFMATSGYSLENGFTSGSIEESEIKRMVLTKAKTRVMLMDVTKAARVLPFTFAEMENIEYLISDSELPDEIRQRAEEHNVGVIIAGGE
jgi:DeoR family transcriptional regulator, fructose operon transcriptional repressor